MSQIEHARRSDSHMPIVDQNHKSFENNKLTN